MRPVALPVSNGKIVGAAFSRDSKRLAILRSFGATHAHAGLLLQIVDLGSARELLGAEIPVDESADILASNNHFVAYSGDDHALLLAANGSDVITILDATNLKILKQISLHPTEDSQRLLGDHGHRYLRGVVSATAASKADLFGLLTHDELQGNEISIGSFTSGQIIKSWRLGRGRTATQLGQVSLSLSDEGSRVAVSMLPENNRIPKAFNNVCLYDTRTGGLLKSVRIDELIGQIMLLPGESVLLSRIDTARLFSKKACIEKWNLDNSTPQQVFCDDNRDAEVAMSASVPSHRVVGFGARIRKSLEGQVYAGSGRVDVWDLESGDLLVTSTEIGEIVPHIEVSTNGQWLMADQTLLRVW